MPIPENPNEQSLQGAGTKPNNLWAVSPREFLFRYIRYLPWIIIAISLSLFLAFLKIRYTVQIFREQASMLIKNDNSKGTGGKDERFEELFMAQDNTNLSNEIELLKSTPVLQRVVLDLKLQTSYYSKGQVRSALLYANSPLKLEIMSKGDSAQSSYIKINVMGDGKFTINENKTIYNFGQIIDNGVDRYRLLRDSNIDLRPFGKMEFEVYWQPLADAAQSLASAMKVIQVNDQATILTLSIEGESSAMGKDVLNTLMAVYDTLTVEDKNRISSNTLQFISARLFELNDTLKGSEGRLRDFMVENQVFNVEGQSKDYLEKIGEGSKQRNEMEVRVAIVNFLLEYISDRKNLHELVPTNLGIEEPALLQSVSEYNRLQLERDNNLRTAPATNPLISGMDNTLDKLRRDIHQVLLNVKQAYTIAANNLEKQSLELHDHITSLPGKSMQLINKERQQKIYEELYSLLLQKQLELRLSSASTISNSKVVEPARISIIPASPDKKKIYTFYFLLGLLIPVGIIAIKEVLQDKIMGRADIEKNTNSPILGEIGHSSDNKALVVTHNSRRIISEQFRIVRTNLQYIIGKKDRPTIMVTSTFSGEGKSFISTNIGAVMALSGKKTVIMEFDIRKPKIVSGLDLKRKMGITNYIIGKATFDELLVKVDGVDGLYVIPCGPIPPNPSEILLDKRLDELMMEVKERFEVVIMDTAPIGLVSDAAALGCFADCTIYIVRQGQTFRKQLRLVEELYTSKKLPNLCVLMNDAKSQDSYYGGYYGNGYGYYGGYSYGSDSGYFEEEPAKNKAWKGLGFLKRLWKNIFG